MNISLPADLRKWVNTQVKEGGFGTASEYVRDMLRRARERQVRRRIDDMLLEAIASDHKGDIADAAFWDNLREQARREATAARKTKQ